jgi:hypothetical protein
MKSDLTDIVSKLLNDNNSFPNVAVQIAQPHKTKLSNGVFISISNKTEVVESLTNEMHYISKDKHLHVFLMNVQVLVRKDYLLISIPPSKNRWNYIHKIPIHWSD